MAIVSSFGAVQALTTKRNSSFWSSSEMGGSLSLGSKYTATYGQIWRTQPNVRICVDFLARNIAQLDVHAFRRLADDDRQRLAEHEIERWLGNPNPGKCEFRLIEDIVSDFAIYWNAAWLKIRIDEAGRRRVGLVRLLPEQLTIQGGVFPKTVTWTLEDGTEKDIPIGDVVLLSGYSPSSHLTGVSPLETLRRILAEEYAATEARTAFWRNHARAEAVIEVAKDAPWARHTPEQKTAWQNQFTERYSGPANAGKRPVLEPGMQLKTYSQSAKDSEYVDARKLSREECAAAFHIPAPFVGILEHATFSNIKEQHKHLYADCLGPWLKMLTQEIQRQLLPECVDQDRVYLEFNIKEKLKGSFEEEVGALNVAVGRPWMTVNEARARQNMRRMNDPEADKLAAQPGTGDSNQADDDAVREGQVVDDDARAMWRQLAALSSRPILGDGAEKGLA